jgi:hypothetical protein
VRERPLLALISGGSSDHFPSSPLHLSASHSSDPEGSDVAAMDYSWQCLVRPSGNISQTTSQSVCRDRHGSLLPQRLKTMDLQLWLYSNPQSDLVYSFQLTVSKGSRSVEP